jgi:hypothetical protein
MCPYGTNTVHPAGTIILPFYLTMTTPSFPTPKCHIVYEHAIYTIVSYMILSARVSLASQPILIDK